MKAALIAIITILILAGCQSPGSIEQRLIGTWASPTVRILPGRNSAGYRNMIGDVIEITFTDDHKETWRYRGAKRQSTARWHVEGNDLVYTLESSGESTPAGTTKRERIKKLTSAEVVFTDGTEEGRWTRVR